MTTRTQTILVCAATRWEVEPLRRVLNGNATLIKTGVGPACAQAALAAIAPGDFRAVVSAGFAGALQPGMETGDIVMDLRGGDAELPPLARQTAQAVGVSLHFAKIIYSPKVIAGPEEKQSLGRERRAGAVDMESETIAAWAAERGVAFFAARAVLDRVQDRLIADVPSAEDPATLARYAWTHAKDWPLLLATALRQRRAAAALAKFLPEMLKLL